MAAKPGCAAKNKNAHPTDFALADTGVDSIVSMVYRRNGL